MFFGAAFFYFWSMNPAEAYILKQPEPFRSMLLRVQLIIEQTLTDAVMEYKWSIPVYTVNKKVLCYLNVTKGYLDVAFWAGERFTKHKELLVSKDRKFIKSLRYHHMDEIDELVLIEILEEAYGFKDVPFKAR